MLVSGDPDTSLSAMVEPEAMSYGFPPQERVFLTFIGPAHAPQFELVHGPEHLTIWRPADAEVWATLAAGGQGDEPAALRAVALGMMDLHASGRVTGTPLAERLPLDAARSVYGHGAQIMAEGPVTRTMATPPLMAPLAQIADLQRRGPALCAFGERDGTPHRSIRRSSS